MSQNEKDDIFSQNTSGSPNTIGGIQRGNVGIAQLRNQSIGSGARRYILADGSEVNIKKAGIQARIHITAKPQEIARCDAQVWCESGRVYYDEPYILRSTDGLFSWYIWCVKAIQFNRGAPWGGSCRLEFFHLKDEPVWKQG